MTIISESVQQTPAAPAAVRPLRVAHVVTKFTAGAGGIALRGALALDPRRYSATILAAEGGSLIGQAEEAALPVVRLQHMAPGRGIYPGEDRRGMRELTAHLAGGGFDVVHTHSAKAGALGRIAARRADVPTVVHSFHGFPFHDFQAPPQRRALIAIERRLAAITDYFVASGTVVAAEAVRLGIAPPDRIRSFVTVPIADGIVSASPAARRRARRLMGVPDTARVVGTVARLDGQKSPLDMVKAIAALEASDVVLVWVGGGPLRSQTERLAAREGIADRCLLLGERQDVPSLLPGFDVFALSSLYEGLPCAAVEAMICGVPVVATAVNSVPEIVIPGRTGLLARPGDPASLARALAYVLDHPDEGARMAGEAGELIGDRFRPEALGREFMEVYDLAAGLRAERRAGPTRTADP